MDLGVTCSLTSFADSVASGEMDKSPMRPGMIFAAATARFLKGDDLWTGLYD